MPKLVLANPHSRAMVARPRDLPPESWRGCDVEAARMLWSLDAEDIAIIPGPLDKDFLAYLTGLLGMTGAVPMVLSMQDYNGIHWYPGDNPELFAAVQDRISGSGIDLAAWSVSYYVHDRDVAHWEHRLGLSTGAAAYAQDLATMVNSKAVFRALAVATGTSIPEGCVVDAGPELLDATVELLDRTGSVIVKQDQNSGGLGNTLITTDPAITGFGAFHVITVDSDDDLTTQLPRALRAHDLMLGDRVELPRGATQARFIVEVYQPGTRSLSSELYIPPSGAPILRNYGEMRMEPMWKGFAIPPQHLPTTVHAEFGAGSHEIALTAQRLGYHGLINIDAIVGNDNQLTYTEFNGRAGGATNLDTIARRLLGQDYLHHHVLLTRIGVPAPRTCELVNQLTRTGLHFDSRRRSGVVIAADDPITGTIEYLVIADDHTQAEDIELQLEALLADR
ncbi:peptide ligase PGM1-related protein [Nocardia sp. NBC_01009]|uniref:peptide ligase PGM1-related protein n=1 Tax=Nocardia sp. NBC_01009 TaxID=2975996 RepID=UPI0038708625|nr:peptide ligase PGM1-related protein [Nocardia sp. NBC_01009]